MTRMSREFSLVLLGAGILTAGYFAAPSSEEEVEKKADEQAAHRVGHPHGTHRVGHVPLIFFVHSSSHTSGVGRSPAAPSVSRGGFGGVGRGMGAGGS